MLRDINEINWTHAYFNELWYVHFFAVSKNMCCTKLDHSIEKNILCIHYEHAFVLYYDMLDFFLLYFSQTQSLQQSKARGGSKVTNYRPRVCSRLLAVACVRISLKAVAPVSGFAELSEMATENVDWQVINGGIISCQKIFSSLYLSFTYTRYLNVCENRAPLCIRSRVQLQASAIRFCHTLSVPI